MRRVVSLWLPRFATDLRRRRQAPGGRRAARSSGDSRANTDLRRGACGPPFSSGFLPPGEGGFPGPARVDDRPLALVDRERGRLLLAAVDAAAERGGLSPGLPLAGARALIPELATAPYDPAGDAQALARLVEWCGRYTPWAALDGSGCDLGGAAGILLDVTGCAHLFADTDSGGIGSSGENAGGADSSGETALLADLSTRLERLGFAARAALAETPGAAWALARFAAPAPGGDPRWTVVPPGALRAALAPLAPAALRLPPATVELMERLGLRRIGELFELPPAALAPRFGPCVARRLAQALGTEAEPISPRQPVPAQRARRVFTEPIVAPGDIARALEQLLGGLCRGLEEAQLGARRLELTTYRVDGSTRRLGLGTSRPTRDPAHLARLFAEHLERVDPGFGIEVMTLAATATQDLSALQLVLSSAEAGFGGDAGGDGTPELSDLIDRLGSRLGLGNVRRLVPYESHVPERAVARVPALQETASAWRGPGRAPALGSTGPPRPLRLLPRAEPIEAIALLPDHPPVRFRWRRLSHKVARAEGPERIEPEWWQAVPALAEAPARDYFRVEVEDGRRYWLYRADGRWFLHGVFG
jgi:protein ImuB